MKFIKNKKYSLLSNILKYSFVFVIAFTLVMPLMVGAIHIPGHVAATTTGGKSNSAATTTDGKSITGIDFKITNPIKVDTIPEFIELVLNIVLTIGIPIVALAIIYCGFLFVKAMGNSEALKKAKGALMYTIIGAFLLLGAWVLATAIQATVDDITKTT
ncbi:hypothetical protein IT400_02505 [Candidatus Nomurabacteria bacterium]|nr:hypothetical protein [Candidatus Nomurabacteria bacterium]